VTTTLDEAQHTHVTWQLSAAPRITRPSWSSAALSCFASSNVGPLPVSPTPPPSRTGTIKVCPFVHPAATCPQTGAKLSWCASSCASCDGGQLEGDQSTHEQYPLCTSTRISSCASTLCDPPSSAPHPHTRASTLENSRRKRAQRKQEVCGAAEGRALGGHRLSRLPHGGGTGMRSTRTWPLLEATATTPSAPSPPLVCSHGHQARAWIRAPLTPTTIFKSGLNCPATLLSLSPSTTCAPIYTHESNARAHTHTPYTQP